MVEFYDLKRLNASIGTDLTLAVDGVVRGGGFVGGEDVACFEAEFARIHGVSDAAGCGSGTDALSLALRGLGIGPGDEVVVPAMTFVATAEAVVHVGATPVFADVDPVTLLLTNETVRRVAGPATKAIIPVHLYGTMVCPDDMRAWQAEGWKVIEDAAQAHLASRGGEGVGKVGDAACFSFYPAKNLGAFGDAGAIASMDAGLIETVKRLRDHGRQTKYRHDVVGYCSRLDALQAAVLRAKLPHLSGWTRARQGIASLYERGFSGMALSVVPYCPGAVHHLFVIRVQPERRSGIMRRMKDLGVGAGLHYPLALTQQPSMRPFRRADCPSAEDAAASVLSIPMDPLMTAEDVTVVIGAVRQTDLSQGSRPYYSTP